MNASGERMAAIVMIQKGGTIDTVGFRTGIVTVAGTLRVSLQDVGTLTGDPDGTQDQFRDVTSPVTNTYYETGLITSDGTDGGTKRTVSAGDLLAIVVDFASFTTENLQISSDAEYRGDMNFPYFNRNTGAWSPQNVGCVGHIKYDDGSYEQLPGLVPWAGWTTTTFNSGSTPDEHALKFTLPFDCRIVGFWHYVDLDNPCDFVLYNDSDVAQTTKAIHDDVQQNPTNARPGWYFFDSPVEYVKDLAWRLSMKPGASNSTVYYVTVNSGLLAAAEFGTAMVLSTRTDAGAWTDNSDARPMLGLLIDQIHDDDGGGGGIAAFDGNTQMTNRVQVLAT